MSRNLSALLLALFLAAISISVFINKVTTSSIPVFPNQSLNSWYVEAKISPDSQQLSSFEQLPSTIEFYLPRDSQRYQITEENFINQGFDCQIETNNKYDNRIAIFTQNNSTQTNEALFYRATVENKSGFDNTGKNNQNRTLVAGQQLVDQELSKSIKAGQSQNLQKNLPTEQIESVLQDARVNSNNDLEFINQIYQLSLNPDDIRIQTIQRGLTKPESTLQTTAFLLNQADIPARIGYGVYLQDKEAYSSDFVEWLEIQSNDEWLVFDLVDRSLQSQDSYLTWWYGTDSVLRSQDADYLNLEVVVQPNTDYGLTQSVLEEETTNSLIKYSLLGLPLSTQRVFQILVLIPIGALVISILHQMVGLTTFGTFTPILISLTFRQTGILMGISLFVFVVVIGLLLRGYLNKLQLLVVPRLASILTVTVLIVGALAVALENLDLNMGLSVSLFPIVILAMTIERASTMWEEEGAKETIIAGLGTIVASVIGYFCMINNYVAHWAFMFPELLLIILGINILIGRYNGYRLIEYFRFLSLQKKLSNN